MKYVTVMSCRDCTGSDPMGCFDGEPWEYGPYDTREEAEEKGRKEAAEVGPWEWEVKKVDDDYQVLD